MEAELSFRRRSKRATLTSSIPSPAPQPGRKVRFCHIDDEEAEGLWRRGTQQGCEGAQGQALHHPQMRRHAPLLARLVASIN